MDFVTNIGFPPSPRRCSASCCARCSGQRTSPPSTSTPWWCANYPPLQPTVVSPRDGRTAAAAAAHRLRTDVAGLCPRRGTRRRRQHAGRPSGSSSISSAREPERLAAILARTRQNGYGENFRGWRQEKIASIAVPVCQSAAGYRLPEPGLYRQRDDH